MRTARARTGPTGRELLLGMFDPACTRTDESWRRGSLADAAPPWSKRTASIGSLMVNTSFERVARWMVDRIGVATDCKVYTRPASGSHPRAVMCADTGRVFQQFHGMILEVDSDNYEGDDDAE